MVVTGGILKRTPYICVVKRLTVQIFVSLVAAISISTRLSHLGIQATELLATDSGSLFSTSSSTLLLVLC